MPNQAVREQIKLIKAITEARKEAKLSQVELSLRIGKSRTLMQKIESGARDVRWVEVVAIARAIGIDPLELFRRALR